MTFWQRSKSLNTQRSKISNKINTKLIWISSTKYIETKVRSQAQWHVPVVPPLWKAEARGSQISPVQTTWQDLLSKFLKCMEKKKSGM